jgi:hypothetical protein
LDFGNTLDNAIVKLLGFIVFDPGPTCGPQATISKEVCEVTIVRRTSPLRELVSLRHSKAGA